MNRKHAASTLVNAATVAVLTSTVVAGCSSGNEAPEKAPARPSVAAPAPDHPVPTKIANDPDIRDNITQTKCAAIPGGWSAQGTAKNPGRKEITYKIIVHFTTTKATTLDYAQTRVTVPPGETTKWSAEKHFAAQREMLCPMPGISIVS
ncbi:hypothetical protein ABGB17_35195 [Sphaerisporangium sp. B11E5]|uniref:hypothetical protein n=1 Tax=Sphaerisporangium sp. B11E5 TaxID=3153563 RepID=UPI00325DFDE7